MEVLTETGWTPLASKPISIYISNKYLTTVITSSTGAYNTTATINEAGDYILKSDFQGEGVEIPWVPILFLLGAIMLVRGD